MIRARIWGREVAMQGSPWTFVEYRRAFGGDLLADFLEASKKDPVELDGYLKAAWAMCRTADRATPDFERWCGEFPDFTLAEGQGAAFVSVVDSAFVAELFRPPETRIRRLWRKVREGWLGLLSRRRRAREARLLAR